MTDCPHTNRVDAFYDLATGEHETQWIVDHVRACPACAQRLRQLREISTAFTEFVPDGMPRQSQADLRATVRRAADRAPARFAWEMTGLAASLLVAATIWIATVPASADAGTPAWERAAITGGQSLVTPADSSQSQDTAFASQIVSDLSADSTAQPEPRQ
jgi:hypothetical protein